VDLGNARLLLIRQRSGTQTGRAEKALKEHIEILEALKKMDKPWVEHLMEEHIIFSRNNITKFFCANLRPSLI